MKGQKNILSNIQEIFSNLWLFIHVCLSVSRNKKYKYITDHTVFQTYVKNIRNVENKINKNFCLYVLVKYGLECIQNK